MQPTATLHPITGATVRREVRSLFLGRAAAALFAMSLLALASAPALARDDDDDWGYSHRQIRNFDTWADGQLVDVQLRVDGEGAPLYFVPGRTDRHYLQAFAGRNYSIVLRNNSGRRIALLLAVDGLNAVNGEITRLRSSEPMYVLGPWEQATISGWRTSLDEIRRFVFVDEQRSYAERTGQANGDLGWIRVLSFREQRPLALNELWWSGRRAEGRMDDRSRERAAAPAPAPGVEQDELQKAAPESRAQGGAAPQGTESFPGTGWGDRRNDPARRVEVNPEAQATDHLALRYEYESGLRALGIFPERRYRLWEREDGRLGFAQPPRW